MYFKYILYVFLISFIAFSSAKAQTMHNDCPPILIPETENTLHFPEVTAKLMMKNLVCQRINRQIIASFDIVVRAEKNANVSTTQDLRFPLAFYTIIHSKQNHQEVTNKNTNSVMVILKPQDSVFESVSQKKISLLIPQNAPYEPKITLGFVK